MKRFKDGTMLFDIINDGWCRDLPPIQVHEEVNEMGYQLTLADVVSFIMLFQDRYDKHMELEELEGD